MKIQYKPVGAVREQPYIREKMKMKNSRYNAEAVGLRVPRKKSLRGNEMTVAISVFIFDL